MKVFDVSIIEYLGRLNIGVLVLINILYEDAYYESTFFYTDQDILLTIPEELESIIGDIKTHEKYTELMSDILKKVIPYSEIYDRIDNVDFTKWVNGLIEMGSYYENIDSSEVEDVDNGDTHI